MSAAVETSHQGHFLPLLDTMARPGSGWGHDPYAPRHGGYYAAPQEQQQIPQGQQPQSGRLPGPSSLFSAPSASTLPPAAPAPPHQLPASPSNRDAHYNGGPQPTYYRGDYTTPSPMSQTPPPLPMPMPEQQTRHPPVDPRRHPDIRLSPTQSSTANERSEDLAPPDGPGSDSGDHGHPPSVAPLARGAPPQQAPVSAPNFAHMQQPIRQPTNHEDGRYSTATGGMMGKLVPQSYSANGRPPRPAVAPPTTVPSTQQSQPQPQQQQQQQQHRHQQQRPPQPPPHQAPNHNTLQQPPYPNPERQAPVPRYQLIQQQQQRLFQRQRQKYSASPPPAATKGYQPSQQQQQPLSHQNTMSPRQDARQMSIHSLLSGAGANSTASSSSRAAEPKMGLGLSSRADTASSVASPSASKAAAAGLPVMTSTYKIRVRQQPVAARSCGFGERDRRVIDPPPIVQLSIEDPSLSPDEISTRLRHPFSVVHCSIWNETGEQDNSAMPEDYRQQRRLMGTLVASPFVGQDDKGEEGCFFCFPDLSCRTPGSFRLKFALVVINPTHMQMGSKAPILATAMSDVFTVYNAKDFPGMQASTRLTKRLKEQGCLISIKKGNEKQHGGPGGSGSGGGGSRDRYDSDDDDDDDGSGGGPPVGGSASAVTARRKRQRRT